MTKLLKRHKAVVHGALTKQSVFYKFKNTSTSLRSAVLGGVMFGAALRIFRTVRYLLSPILCDCAANLKRA